MRRPTRARNPYRLGWRGSGTSRHQRVSKSSGFVGVEEARRTMGSGKSIALLRFALSTLGGDDMLELAFEPALPRAASDRIT